MLKKTVVLGSVVAGICAAPTMAHGSYFKSGFLAGGHVGVSNGWGSFNDVFNPNQAVGDASNASGKGRKTSALLGVFGGYRHIFNEGFTLGMDVAANFLTNNELKKTLNHIQGGVDFPFIDKLTRQYAVIPSINIGKIFCGRYHAYLGLGLAISKFKHSTNIVDAAATVNSSQVRLGFVPTVGIEYAVTHNVSVFGNVSAEIYQKLSKTYDVSAQTGLPGATYKSSISPRYVNLKVGAVYRF